MANDKFIPSWTEDAPEERSYRSIFKWGAPDGFKHPNPKLYKLMKEKFNLSDDDFKEKTTEGREEVKLKQKSKLTEAQVKKFIQIVGEENVSSDDYDRLKFASGKTIEEAMNFRNNVPNKVADLVVHPKDKKDVQEIVNYCNKEKIPIYVYGGGSSVNFGLLPSKGGVTLVMSTHMNKVLELNEENHTATIQAGMMGPAYEEILNNAVETFEAKRAYTCGHFPQSFEYSTVGGWIVTLGSGQQSTHYGDAGDLVISQEYITPAGTFTTLDYPATATGPKVSDIMLGSEGSFGILVEVTLKVFRYTPQNRQKFAFMFKTWEETVEAAKEITQGEFGNPSVFRISDPEETDVALKLYNVEGTPIDSLIKLRGFKPMERCLLIGWAEGDKDYAKLVKKKIKKVAKKNGGMYLTGYPVKNWEHGRYKDPYMREDLQDYGILIDTLETGVTWEKLPIVHKAVREYVKSKDGRICMSHGSHFYPQGTNLYFIYMAKIDDVKEYKELQDGVLDAILKSGGSMSHHHGVGKMIAPWMEHHLGKEQMDVLRALKNHFDPNNIMNPGGQMGLDLPKKAQRKLDK